MNLCGGLTLVDKEDGIPYGRIIGERGDVHPQGAVRLISQRSILEGNGSTREMIDGKGPRNRFTRCLFRGPRA
jgi:hypothetical protein